jgi:deoxyribodipyrimidine photolyase-related protein
MQIATLVFPHQLFEQTDAFKNASKIILVEEYLFFNQYNFHKQKLVLHRASMKFYKQWLIDKGFDTLYVDATNEKADVRKLIKWLAEEKFTAITYAGVHDNWLQKRIAESCNKYKLEATVGSTPYFLNTEQEANEYFDKKTRYFQTDFYIDQRKKRRILLDDAQQPAGGHWSYDADNRLKFPKNEKVPLVSFPAENDYVTEAKKYVLKNYPGNYGSIEIFFYPTNFAEAEKWLDDFLKNRFEKFGIYEDAIVAEKHFLHHSVLSPLLNIGLLTPQQVLDKTLAFASKHKVPLNSVEGFVRQIIGWREFIHIVYQREGTKQRTKNYWGFSRKIPASFWQGKTGIVPIDTVVKKVLDIGYCHHIERLMVLGNFMLLCEFDPNDVYQWFMELFVDAYDWVMVPNVYGMTQFADGGLMTTKPYISGSNYLLKMSNFKKGPWTEIWDGLFWRFMHVNRDFFSQNPRLRMLLKTFDNMPEQKRQTHLENADFFLQQLDRMQIDK